MFDFNKEINLDGTLVSKAAPTYFIAEIGGNFSTFEEAKKLIDDAKVSGANSVKFQTLEAETITTKNNYIGFNKDNPTRQYDNFKSSEISKELQIEVVKYAKKIGLTVFSAPSHIKDFEFMESELDIPIYKIGSDLLTHIPLLIEIAKTKKPMILSTGLSTMQEIRDSVEAIHSTGFKDLILLQCVSNYPCAYDEVNLNAMLSMQNEFGCLVGYSDHTLDIEISLAASVMGACVIERHFTYDKTLPGPDHKLSSTKEEFKKLITYTRNIELATGTGIKVPTYSELKSRETNRCSIIVMNNMKNGDVITANDIDIRRPGNGLAPKYYDTVIGKKIKIDIKAETPLLSNMLE
ncbi:N-acetylneuraminate synthase family protein [Sulfurimonas sp.]|uniref:N-acetylneuraminate synthase family protein n=1 Tax=Sulfurimonas sp. TaxID=2022749 RepID=UPI0035655469